MRRHTRNHRRVGSTRITLKMLAQFQLFPERASTMAPKVDALYFYLLAVSSFFVILIAGLIFIFAIRYRRSVMPAYPRQAAGLEGYVQLEIIWSVIPLILTMVMFGWGAVLFVNNSTPPNDSMEVYVIGKQWMWRLQHPTGRREINELHVPLGQPVKLIMTSEDVIHDLYIPAFRVKQDVLPGRYTELWFEATMTGQFHLFCAEYCGTEHSDMVGRVVVMEPTDFQEWLSEQTDTEPLAVRGFALFQRYRCHSCHARPDEPRAPSLEGKFGSRVALASGETAVFDEDYIRESILNPQTKVVTGYQPIMPSYENQISEAEILAIIDYLKASQETASDE